MSNTGKVYMIISPSNRIYVGSTKRSLKERWWYYYNLHCKNQIRLYNSLIKYGPQNHTFHKIWEGDVKDMYKIEAKYGRLLNVLDHKKGLNCQLPKESNEYECFSEETKIKMRTAWKNREPVSLETRLKLSNSLKNRKISKESIEKRNITKKGFKHSEKSKKLMSNSAKLRPPISKETRIKISLASKNISETTKEIHRQRMLGNKYGLNNIPSSFTRIKMGKAHKKPILQYDLYDNFIKEWDSAKDASNELLLTASNITACCKNKVKRVKQFKFKYK